MYDPTVLASSLLRRRLPSASTVKTDVRRERPSAGAVLEDPSHQSNNRRHCFSHTPVSVSYIHDANDAAVGGLSSALLCASDEACVVLAVGKGKMVAYHTVMCDGRWVGLKQSHASMYVADRNLQVVASGGTGMHGSTMHRVDKMYVCTPRAMLITTNVERWLGGPDSNPGFDQLWFRDEEISLSIAASCTEQDVVAVGFQTNCVRLFDTRVGSCRSISRIEDVFDNVWGGGAGGGGGGALQHHIRPAVTSVEFSANGRMLVCGGNKGLMKNASEHECSHGDVALVDLRRVSSSLRGQRQGKRPRSACSESVLSRLSIVSSPSSSTSPSGEMHCGSSFVNGTVTHVDRIPGAADTFAFTSSTGSTATATLQELSRLACNLVTTSPAAHNGASQQDWLSGRPVLSTTSVRGGTKENHITTLCRASDYRSSSTSDDALNDSEFYLRTDVYRSGVYQPPHDWSACWSPLTTPPGVTPVVLQVVEPSSSSIGVQWDTPSATSVVSAALCLFECVHESRSSLSAQLWSHSIV